MSRESKHNNSLVKLYDVGRSIKKKDNVKISKYNPVKLIDNFEDIPCREETNQCCPPPFNNCSCIPPADEWSEYLYWNTDRNKWEIGGGSTNDLQRVHLGKDSGFINQEINGIAIGNTAGSLNQRSNSIALGWNAGYENQGVSTTLVGNAIAIGNTAGYSNQRSNSIALGWNAGQFNQGVSTTLLGNAIAIGTDAGTIDQSFNAIAIGLQAGDLTQGNSCVAIGTTAGKFSQGEESVAIGKDAGQNFQLNASIAIGRNAGQNNQNSNSIAIGNTAGINTQREFSVAIGSGAGAEFQGPSCVAIGNRAGGCNQRDLNVAIGYETAQNDQKDRAVAIGYRSGRLTQGIDAIAIGQNAGENNQGQNSIAIGRYAGSNNQAQNSIVINATGVLLDNNTPNSCKIAPIRLATNGNILYYDAGSSEVTYGAKTFVIEHPIDKNKYLQHACLEGPEVGVYYRGESEITNNTFVEIQLPDYVDKIASDFTVQLTPIVDDDYKKGSLNIQLYSTKIKHGKFKVFGDNIKFYWTVIGKRHDLIIEPSKFEYELKGDGPYTYLTKN